MTDKPKLIISDMYRSKNKIAFFAIHQAMTKLPEFELEFHILWDDVEHSDEWSEKIDNLNCRLISYNKKMLDKYCLDSGISTEQISKFKKFPAIYFVIHGHYLKKNNITDYYLIYDDDIILTDELSEFKNCLKNKIPCLIHEPLNINCDKSLAMKLFNMYGGENAFEYYKYINPNLLGFNAGIQGISLDMYEDFLEDKYFKFLIEIFDYSGIYDDTGKEIMGPNRTIIDTQQQSFFSIMNIIRSKTKPHILNTDEYFVCPNWGTHPVFGEIDHNNEYNGWDVNMKSKIIHFIGHTILNGVYYGKPKIYNDMVEEYLKKYNFI